MEGNDPCHEEYAACCSEACKSSSSIVAQANTDTNIQARGESVPCVVSDLLEEIDAGESYDELVIADTAGAAYAGS
jgi:hypothetical protein